MGLDFSLLISLNTSIPLIVINANFTSLTLEQHGFEMCRSTYMQIVFNKYKVSRPSVYWVSHPQIQPTTNQN